MTETRNYGLALVRSVILADEARQDDASRVGPMGYGIKYVAPDASPLHLLLLSTMPMDPRQSGPRLRFVHVRSASAQPVSLWQKVVGVAVAAGVFVLALTFSLVLFAVIATVGVVVGGWFWWKTRVFRKQMREAMEAARREAEATGRAPSGDRARRESVIIEGEVIREVREPEGEETPKARRD